MEKAKLANELRARQRECGEVPAHVIRSLSDDQIIDAYITCSCCGEKQVEGSDLDYAITTAKNTDHFFEIADKFGQIKHAVNHSSETNSKDVDMDDEDEDYEDEEDEDEEPVYLEGDIGLFTPDLVWAVTELEDEEDVYLNTDAILRTSWDVLLAQSTDAPAQDEHRLPITADQAQRFKDFQAGRFWLEEVRASIDVKIGEAMPVTLESAADPMVIASDASQNDHRNCEQSAISNLAAVLTRMGLDGRRILQEVKFERYRETPSSELKSIAYVPGKGDKPQKRTTDSHIRKGRRL